MEVIENWLSNQDPIGGTVISVEIDETFIVRRKFQRGRPLSQLWLFGGIERETKRKFVIPLSGDVGNQRNKETLFPLIQKNIKRGSVVYSDSWKAYNGLDKLWYTHFVVNHSQNLSIQT